ncbi:MAG: hypothetical protein Q9191_003062 [Dirinaria sp. TL-2023a]
MQDYMPQWPLKILILSSDPRNADRLRLAQEHRDLQNAIRGTRFASSLNVFNGLSCQYSDITAALDRFDPHILHFSGHGGEDVLYFEDVQGITKPVKKQALANVLRHQKELQLVILNTCFSLDQGQAFADAVGLAIVSEGSILDQDAIDFSREFYTALGYGQRSYIEAFERAKSALEMTGETKVHLLRRDTPDAQDVSAYSSSVPDGHWFPRAVQLTGLSVTGHFVDRDPEMEAIERHLLPKKTQIGRKIYILYGLGGIGKTQLAIAHARKHQHAYSAILWVNGNSRDTVLQSLSAFGRRAGVDGVLESTAHAAQQPLDMEVEAAAVLRWLALEGNHRWLMIFDNVDRDVQSSEEDTQAFKFTSFLPPADHGSVLITTRLHSLRGMGQSTEVGIFKLDQAQELLSYHSGLHSSSHGKISITSEAENTSPVTYFADMTKLIQRLGCLPLALVQAGIYMYQTKTGCSKYLDLYKASWTQLTAETPRLQDYENGSIQTTWMISYEHVRQSNRVAGKLLQLWGYLDRQDIWYELFLRGRKGCPEEFDWLQKLAGSEIVFKRVMKSLLDYSLIESHGDRESYSVHPVVHDWCTETISHGQDDLMLAALTIVGTAAPGHAEAEYWLLEQRLLPHVDRCIQQINDLEEPHRLESAEAVDAFGNLGLLYKDQSKHAEAEKMYQRALNGYEKAWGSDHTSTLGTVNNLGVLYTDQGKHAEAEKMYRRALDGYMNARGSNHLNTRLIARNLALLRERK